MSGDNGELRSIERTDEERKRLYAVEWVEPRRDSLRSRIAKKLRRE